MATTSEPGERRVGDEDAARGAHRERLAHRLGRVGGAIERSDDLALAGRLDELERRLERVLVVAVDDRRAAARSSRPSGPSRSPPDAGSGTGFVEDDDAHEPIGPPLGVRAISRPCRAAPAR